MSYHVPYPPQPDFPPRTKIHWKQTRLGLDVRRRRGHPLATIHDTNEQRKFTSFHPFMSSHIGPVELSTLTELVPVLSPQPPAF